MGLLLTAGQVQQADPTPNGPNPNSNSKQQYVKIAKLSSANFTTGGTDTLLVSLPNDAAIINMRLWVKTQLSGGSISAATLSLGSAAGGTGYVNASTLAFGTAGANTVIPVVNSMMQLSGTSAGPSIDIWGRGTATTGNPTGGELYLIVEYVR